MRLPEILTLAGMLLSAAAFGAEAPPSMNQFNVSCPAKKLLPTLDQAYHECNNAFANGSCVRFVEYFQKLVPEYDCQRSFDSTSGKNYIVPAIWLADEGAFEDYVRLLWRLASSKDKILSQRHFGKAIASARHLFGSKEFQHVLDGAMAEEYMPRSISVAKSLERKPN